MEQNKVNNLQLTTYNLLQSTLKVLFIAYFISIALDSLMKGFISYYLNLNYLLYFIVFLSIFFITKIKQD